MCRLTTREPTIRNTCGRHLQQNEKLKKNYCFGELNCIWKILWVKLNYHEVVFQVGGTYSLKSSTDDRYLKSYITYIIGYYNPSDRIIDLVSHTTYVAWVNFIHKWRDIQFKVDSERHFLRVFEKLFMAILFILRVFARNLLKGSRRRNTDHSQCLKNGQPLWPDISWTLMLSPEDFWERIAAKHFCFHFYYTSEQMFEPSNTVITSLRNSHQTAS